MQTDLLVQNYKDLRHLIWSDVQYRVSRDLAHSLIDCVHNKVTSEKMLQDIHNMSVILHSAIDRQIFKLLDHIE